MHDLMNRTAAAGGNYVQHEDARSIRSATPLDTITTTVVKGNAYRCPHPINTAPTP